MHLSLSGIFHYLPLGGGGGDNQYNGLYGEAPPERGTFFRLQVYERVGILLVEVYESVGLSVISVRKKAQKGSQIYFKAVKKSRKRSGFVIYSYFKFSAFTLVERDAKF